MKAELTIRGRSLGGIYTSVYVPELGLMFDVGVALRENIGAKAICISHGHVDHIGALPAFLGMRGLFGQREPITVYCPMAIKNTLQEGLKSFETIQTHDFNVTIVGLNPGDEVELGKRLKLRAFRTHHTVPSLGYVVFETVQKLKSEFKGLPGEELRRRRLAGDDIFDVEERRYFAYVTDTLPDVLKHQPWLADVEQLMLECTFLDERKSVKDARRGGHIHLDELLPWFEHLKNKRLHLMHFSQLYTPGSVRQVLAERCPATVIPEIVPLLPQNDHDWWH